jgi:hypothetical protein
MVMKYFIGGISEVDNHFMEKFASLRDPYEMKIFVYEYFLYLQEIYPTRDEEANKRVVTRSIYYHCGFCQYGKVGTNTLPLVGQWTTAVMDLNRSIYPKLDEVNTIQVGRRLEILMGD